MPGDTVTVSLEVQNNLLAGLAPAETQVSQFLTGIQGSLNQLNITSELTRTHLQDIARGLQSSGQAAEQAATGGFQKFNEGARAMAVSLGTAALGFLGFELGTRLLRDIADQTIKTQESFVHLEGTLPRRLLPAPTPKLGRGHRSNLRAGASTYARKQPVRAEARRVNLPGRTTRSATECAVGKSVPARTCGGA